MFQRNSLQVLIEELHAHQPDIDLSDGVQQHAKMKRLNNYSNLSTCLMVIASFLSNWHLYNRPSCDSKIELVNRNTNIVVGDYIDKTIQWNLNYYKDIFENAFISNTFNSLLSHVEPRITYDYNGNGIYGEPGEIDQCTWSNDLTQIYGMIVFVSLVLFLFNIARAWKYDKEYSNLVYGYSKSIYDDSYKKVDKLLIKLEADFDTLSDEQKKEFVTSGLADSDSYETIRLKYLCPLSKCLIVCPVQITTMDQHGKTSDRLYDLKSILPHIKENFIDPMTTLIVMQCAFSQDANKACKRYLIKLEKSIQAAMLKQEAEEVSNRKLGMRKV